MKKAIAKKRCKGVLLQPLSIDFPEVFFCGCESLPKPTITRWREMSLRDVAGENDSKSHPPRAKKGSAWWKPFNIWGVLLVAFFIPGRIGTAFRSEQAAPLFSAPWRMQRKTLDSSSTRIQHGDGRRKQHSLQRGRDHRQRGTGWASSHTATRGRKGQGYGGVRAVLGTCVDNVFLMVVKHSAVTT